MIAYRVITPTLKLADPTTAKIASGLYTDYITTDPKIPADAVYAASLDEQGNVTILVGKAALCPVDHTFAGWPIPA